MSILQYFKSVETDPKGPLSTQIDNSVIKEVNKQVRDVQKKAEQNRSRKRGTYSIRSAKEKAEIGKYACENGVAATVRHFKGMTLKESSVSDWKRL